MARARASAFPCLSQEHTYSIGDVVEIVWGGQKLDDDEASDAARDAGADGDGDETGSQTSSAVTVATAKPHGKERKKSSVRSGAASVSGGSGSTSATDQKREANRKHLAEQEKRDSAARKNRAKIATIVSVCDPLMSKPAKQLRVVSDTPVPIETERGKVSNKKDKKDKKDKLDAELQPNEVVSYVNDPFKDTSTARIWYKLADDRGWVFTKVVSKKKTDAKAADAKLADATTKFDDEAFPLQPFARARSVDVRFAPGSGFTKGERICVSVPGVGAELQSSVGIVSAVNDDGSVDFLPDDGARRCKMIDERGRLRFVVVVERRREDSLLPDSDVPPHVTSSSISLDLSLSPRTPRSTG